MEKQKPGTGLTLYYGCAAACQKTGRSYNANMKQLNRPAFVWCALSFSLLILLGCASPEQRIKKNPELFQSFPPDVQELVKQGQVAIGFTAEMVTMALGEPNRIYSRVTSGGTSDVWSYTGKKSSSDRQRVSADIRYRDSDGRYRSANEWVWVDVARETEYEKTRIEFLDGKVSAIETLEQ